MDIDSLFLRVPMRVLRSRKAVLPAAFEAVARYMYRFFKGDRSTDAYLHPDMVVMYGKKERVRDAEFLERWLRIVITPSAPKDVVLVGYKAKPDFMTEVPAEDYEEFADTDGPALGRAVSAVMKWIANKPMFNLTLPLVVVLPSNKVRQPVQYVAIALTAAGYEGKYIGNLVIRFDPHAMPGVARVALRETRTWLDGLFVAEPLVVTVSEFNDRRALEQAIMRAYQEGIIATDEHRPVQIVLAGEPRDTGPQRFVVPQAGAQEAITVNTLHVRFSPVMRTDEALVHLRKER